MALASEQNDWIGMPERILEEKDIKNQISFPGSSRKVIEGLLYFWGANLLGLELIW